MCHTDRGIRSILARVKGRLIPVVVNTMDEVRSWILLFILTKILHEVGLFDHKILFLTSVKTRTYNWVARSSCYRCVRN